MDERYFLYWEDVDWSFALRRAGYRLAVIPSARMWHEVQASTGNVPGAAAYYWERNRLRFVDRWGSAPLRTVNRAKVILRIALARVTGVRGPDERLRLEAYADYIAGRFGRWRGHPA